MKIKFSILALFLIVLTFVAVGCSNKEKEPLTQEGFKEIFGKIEGETIDLPSDAHTSNAEAIVVGTLHNVKINYYQMESKKDSNELFLILSKQLDDIDDAEVKHSQKKKDFYSLFTKQEAFCVAKDGNMVLYGSSLADEGELIYLFHLLGYYDYGSAYVENIAVETFGYTLEKVDE